MKIFLSTFEVSPGLKRSRPIQSIQEEFLNEIRRSNFPFFDSGEFSSYERIFFEIEDSDVFVAFIDEYWTSSTWKMIELYYASGASPEKNNEFIKIPKKCLVLDYSNNQNITSLIKKHLISTFDGSFLEMKKLLNERKF